jgi:hypothetical protein
MRLKITGASHFVNRMFEAAGNYQWAREFLKNAIEAGATRVEFGIEWQAVEKKGIYRRTVGDNGGGMSSDELLSFFSTLGQGAKKIGGVHENFGVGAKIASLPWNPEGVIVLSYKAGKASMIWIVLNEDTGDYELVEFQIGDRTTCVIDPADAGDQLDGINWSVIKPDWITEHGTVIVLLGSAEYPDTVIGNPAAGEKDIKGLSVYLNSRFWDLTDAEVTVVELRSDKKAQWPQGQRDKDDSRRPNNRRVLGARHFLVGVSSPAGSLKETGTVRIEEGRVGVEWYLWEGDRPAVHSYAKKGGYIAIRYKGELFQLTAHKAHFRWFGIIEGKVQQNVTLILDPQHYQSHDGRWGIHPDQSRNRLSFTGVGEKGLELPLADWGLEFAENMPEAIREAIRDARGDEQASIDDENYRKRLQDKFGDRWKVKRFTVRPTPAGGDGGTATTEDLTVVEPPPGGDGAGGRRKRRRTVKVIRKVATQGGSSTLVESEVPVDVPRILFEQSDAFEKPWHLALWTPNDPEGPSVRVNVDSPILQEIIAYHQAQYMDHYSEEVAKTVRRVFGEIAACKIAHSQKLAKLVPEQELDAEYRSEQALTLALMGLIAEEAVIENRLEKMPRKRAVPTLSAKEFQPTV